MYSACVTPAQQAFYFSPDHATTNHYKPIPLTSESMKTASYLGLMGTVGGSNHRLRDELFAFQANYHRTFQWDRLQGYYGGGASIGRYQVESYTFPGNHVDPAWINPRAGNKLHGSYGLQGGVNYVLPFRRGEWRIIGFELNTLNEFGSYYHFRKEIPQDAANIVERSRWYNSFSLGTDIMGNFSDGSMIGFKMAYSQSFRRLKGMISNQRPLSGIPRFMTYTLHITVRKWTGFGQMNFGSEASNFQLGMIRQLTARRREN